MRKIYFIFGLIAVFGLTMCTPKVKDIASTTVKKTTDFRSQAPKPAPAKAINMGSYEDFSLANGLRVIVVENHKLPRVSFQLSLDNDPIVEGDQAGYTSIAGDLLGRGTKTRTKAQIDDEVDFIGASMNTSRGGMFGSSLKKHMVSLLDVMSDVLLNPAFPQDEFDKLKKQMISGLQTAKDDPGSMSTNVSAVLNFGKDHPYGEQMTEQTVEAVTLQSAKDYYDKYFRPNNAYLVIVGDITPTEAKTMAEKYFGGWKKGNVPTHKYAMASAPFSTQVAFVPKDGAVQSSIRVTYPVMYKPGSSDAIAISVLNNVFGGGFNGRLNQNLREDKGYTYGARSSISSDDLVGRFTASADVRNEVTDSSLTQFMMEMKKMATTNITAEELDFAKNFMSGSFARSMESPQTIARFALNTIKNKLPKDYYNTYLTRLQAVTVEDVARAAKKYIRPDNAHIVVVGNKDEVAGKLSKFSADGKVKFYDLYGEELKEAGDIPAGVTGESVIKDYLAAIGGVDKLKSIKTFESESTIDMGGMSLGMTVLKKAPNKIAILQSMGGQVAGGQIFDGTKGVVMQMGQKKPLEGDALEDMKAEAAMFVEMNYLKEGYQLDLKGVEEIEGDKVYKLVVTKPSGKKSTEYYSQETNLKVKSISTQDGGPQGTMTITSSYADYKAVGGVLFPHSSELTGMAPMALVMKTKTVKVNEAIDDAKFKVD